MSRAALYPLNKNCSLMKSCRYCKSLGFRADTSFNIQSFQKHLEYEIADEIALPCSTFQLEDFEAIRILIRKFKKKIKYVFLFEYWQSLDSSMRETFSDGRIGIILDELAQVNSIEKFHKYYYLIQKKNWDIKVWEKIDLKLKAEIKYFFLPNIFHKDTSFTSDEILQICNLVHETNPSVIFETPFGIDIIDFRNPAHINWKLVPDKMKSFNYNENIKPQISIVIPFVNRVSLLKKVLSSLNIQSIGSNNFEVILVDDGSEIDEAIEVNRFLEKSLQIQILYLYVRRDIKLPGLYIGNRAGPARNLGTKVSRAEIVLYLDCDMLLPSDYLEKLALQSVDYDVTLSRRVYLTEEASGRIDTPFDIISNSDVFEPTWYNHVKDFYARSNWLAEKLAWKYFITYCLSVRRNLIMESGGFRTNFISFGHEDLDLGFRILTLTQKFKILEIDTFHLFHFKGREENTLDMDFRLFQLAMTSRTFVAQNMPLMSHYLVYMTALKNYRQKLIFYSYRFLWILRLIFRKFYLTDEAKP